MTERTLEAYLEDIQHLLVRVRKYTNGKTFADYVSDDLVKAGVEREFITLGEALNGIKRLAPQAAATIPQLARIVAFRNILVHGYHAISDRRVWDVVQEDIDELQSAIEALIRKP